MSSRALPVVAVVVAAVLIGGRLTSVRRWPDPGMEEISSPRAHGPALERRRFQISALAPGMSPALVAALVDRSDAWAGALRDAGVGDIGVEIARRLSMATPGDAEARAFYDDNRELFGGRGYAASRQAVRQLYRIRAVRASLDAGAAAADARPEAGGGSNRPR